MITTYMDSARRGKCAECGKSFIRRAIDEADYGELCRSCYLERRADHARNARAEKKPTDAVREFAERYERRIAELEEQIAEIGAERTCRNIAEPDEMSDRPFTCSECGARGPYGEGTYHIGGSEKKEDGSVVFWDAWPVYKYCPHCGRKVVS